MKIAILHHHLNRGGVTQVVASHLRSLASLDLQRRPSSVLVLHGGRAEGWPESQGEWGELNVRLAEVAGLDYDDRVQLHTKELADGIARTLAEHGHVPGETVLHVHNHSLGKNVSLPGALRELAARGYRLLLQIHDFAEDLRPANYSNFVAALGTKDGREIGEFLYPDARHIHYALLNTRDRRILRGTGIDTARVHLLPNPVTLASRSPPHERAWPRFCEAHGLRRSSRAVLYPVRGIRRKNLGELLLWSAAFDDNTVFALTLPATSDSELPSFERWRRLAAQLNLNVLFNVGLNDDVSFAENLSAASWIITTSVAEGFGLVFLESWLRQRPLVGRNLPDITSDFSERGVDLSHLGESILIPIEWVGAEAFIDQVLALQRELCSAYGQEPPPEAEAIVREVASPGRVDFAALTTRLQVAVIERVARGRESAAELFELNPWMPASLDGEADRWRPLVEANANSVRRNFSLESTGLSLAQIYETLIESSTEEEVTALPQPDAPLKTFLDVRRLTPVRVEP